MTTKEKLSPPVLALNSGHKIRHINWYWGKYIYTMWGEIFDEMGEAYPESQIPGEFEIYQEALHGIHNDY